MTRVGWGRVFIVHFPGTNAVPKSRQSGSGLYFFLFRPPLWRLRGIGAGPRRKKQRRNAIVSPIARVTLMGPLLLAKSV
jgi:hypothetical protein